MTHDATREGEIETTLPAAPDAGLYFIGVIRTPFASRDQCPRQGKADGPVCTIELDPHWAPALKGLEAFERIEVLYWMHRARRDLLLQSPKSDGGTRGTFALRSPVRPNPIATSLVTLLGIDGPRLRVRGLDCLDGTPLIDLKPDRCAYTPLSPPSPSEWRSLA
ncbi:MAG: tRNA (N6-threonylcarbamoyladenosine(37)-N6)-methyltransferase TrmO [Beijerinckiaceae bacterium]|nr:tRNA (N6-threonylcarbamoyladenosine(37)-N6)-methyltransferase TrmO [Beijerinckiaceae bacterium]